MEETVYQIQRICNHLFAVEENGVRSYLIVGAQRALLLDTGFGAGDLRSEITRLTALPVMLVNTHADLDHIGCNAQFDTAHMHPAEYGYYRAQAGEERSVTPLWEGDVIDLGGIRLEVILIPGHTPGSIALLDEENRILFSGDSIQTRNIFMFGPGRSLRAYIASMDKLLGRHLHRFDRVYPAHGPAPVAVDVVRVLRDGAADILAGRVEGRPGKFMNVAATVYDVGIARFMCE